MEDEIKIDEFYKDWDKGKADYDRDIAHNDDADIKAKKRNNDFYDSCAATTYISVAGLNAVIASI